MSKLFLNEILEYLALGGQDMNIYAEATEAKKKEAFANLEGKIKIR